MGGEVREGLTDVCMRGEEWEEGSIGEGEVSD